MLQLFKSLLQLSQGLNVISSPERQPRAAWCESIAFGPQGELFTGCSTGEVGIWNAEDFSQLALLKLGD